MLNPAIQVKSQPVLKEPASTVWLSRVLRGGVFLSAALIGLGLLLFVITGQSGYASDTATSAQRYTNFHQADAAALYFPINPVEVWQGLLAIKPFAIIMFGLLLLIATPVLNIILLAVSFVRRKELPFSLITLFIVAMLAFGFLIGKAGG